MEKYFMKAIKIIVAILVTLFISWVGLIVGDSEIAADVLKEVRIFPGGRMETVWNYQDELYKLILDLQGDHLDGEEKSPDLLQSGTL